MSGILQLALKSCKCCKKWFKHWFNFIQICESAGGLRHPVEEIAAEVKKSIKDIMIVADGITAIGVEKNWCNKFRCSNYRKPKALMLPQVLQWLVLSNAAVEKLMKMQKVLFNLATEIKNKNKYNSMDSSYNFKWIKEILKHIKRKCWIW